MKQPASYWRQPPGKVFQTLSGELPALVMAADAHAMACEHNLLAISTILSRKLDEVPIQPGKGLIRQTVIGDSVVLPFSHRRCGNHLGPRRFTQHCRVNQKNRNYDPQK